MIYRITCDGTDIYGPNVEQAVINPHLEIELNSAGTLEFTLPVQNDAWGTPEVFKSEIVVWEEDDIIWFGRPLQITRDWNNQKKVVCEGALAYFNDTLQLKTEWQPSANHTNVKWFEHLIETHNNQLGLESNKKILVDPNFQTDRPDIEIDSEQVYRKTDFQFTSDCLTSQCLDPCGGYFILRMAMVNDVWVRYIDWVKDMPEAADQPVAFGVNLLNYSNDLNGADICTVLVPTGGDDTYVNELGDRDDGYVTHTSGDYELVHTQGVATYGRIVKEHSWSDITSAEGLWNKGKAWLEEKNKDIPTIEVSAADLHYLPQYADDQGEPQYSKFKVGSKVHVESGPHQFSGDLIMYKISMDLDSGVKQITIGTPPKKELTDIVAPQSGGSSNRGSDGGSSGGTDSGGSGGGGSTYVPVTDVRVKNEGDTKYKSVVDHKVAKIDLSDIGKVKDVKVDGTSVVDENGSANISLPVTDVQVDGTSIVSDGVANLNSSQFGTYVEANPSEIATDDIEKIQIGNIVYNIIGGGGSGGGSFEYSKLSSYTWVNKYNTIVEEGNLPKSFSTESMQNRGVFVLNGGDKENVLNYDAILLLASSNTSDDPCETYLIFTNELKNAPFDRIDNGVYYYDWSDSVFYDFGSIGWREKTHDTSIPTPALYLTIELITNCANYKIEACYAIKFGGGGGTEVIPNPSDPPTDDLTSIQIGDTVYDIPGGGGGSSNYGKFTCDTLFVNDPLPTPTSGTSDVTRTYTLSKSIDDYDAVYVNIWGYYGSNGYDQLMGSLILKKDFYAQGTTTGASNGWIHLTNATISGKNRRLSCCFTDSTTIQTLANRGGSGEEPILYKVYGLKFENKLINRSDIYSEEERIIGRWTDGKPLYQKTLTIPSMPNNTTVSIEHNIANVENIWVYDGFAHSPTTGYFNSVNLPNASTSSQWYTSVGISYIYIWAGSNRTGYNDVKITVRYTKTTDSPGSGVIPEDPQLVMMSDFYSEDEQVVGRWFDGRPIYQKSKVVHIQSGAIAGSNFEHGITGLGRIVDYDYTIMDDPETEVNRGWKNSYYSSSYYISVVNVTDEYIYIRTTGNWNTKGLDITLRVRYIKTTDAPGTGPTKGNLIYLPTLYSEEEREVGVWTDGKPLYQKTIKYTGIAYGSGKILSMPSGLNVETMVKFDYVFKNPSNPSLALRTPREMSSSWIATVTYVNGATQLEYYLGSNWSSYNTLEITIQYTKTTDTPGSGTWTPDGQLAHHYSTSEHIIGTWIDGSPIYERTWDFSASPITISNDGWTNTAIDASTEGIQKILSHEVSCGLTSSAMIVSEIVIGASGYTGKVCLLRIGGGGTTRRLYYLTLQYTKTTS